MRHFLSHTKQATNWAAPVRRVALAASVAVSMASALLSAPGVASASELVRIEEHWPRLEGDCSNSRIAFFQVDGPAFVDIFVEVDPYRGAGRVIWLSTRWSERNNHGDLLGWSSGMGPGIRIVSERQEQGGMETRGFVEGIALVTRQTLHFLEPRSYRYAVEVLPPCDTASNLNRKDQASQRATLIVRYSSAIGAGDKAVAGVAGLWLVVANGYPGTLDLVHEAGAWTGRLDLGAGWEELEDVFVDAATGKISFLRPAAGQRFEGAVGAGGIAGTFDQNGAGAYAWQATRPAGTPEGHLDAPGEPVGDAMVIDPGSDGEAVDTPAPDATMVLAGVWRIHAIGYRGQIEFVIDAEGWTGRENIDGAWEAVVDIVFDTRTGEIEFTRPRVAQRYRGRLTESGLSGEFDQGGQGAYPWSAVR